MTVGREVAAEVAEEAEVDFQIAEGEVASKIAVVVEVEEGAVHREDVAERPTEAGPDLLVALDTVRSHMELARRRHSIELIET